MFNRPRDELSGFAKKCGECIPKPYSHCLSNSEFNVWNYLIFSSLNSILCEKPVTSTVSQWLGELRIFPTAVYVNVTSMESSFSIHACPYANNTLLNNCAAFALRVY